MAQTQARFLIVSSAIITRKMAAEFIAPMAARFQVVQLAATARIIMAVAYIVSTAARFQAAKLTEIVRIVAAARTAGRAAQFQIAAYGDYNGGDYISSRASNDRDF